jgi:hypothetical protein
MKFEMKLLKWLCLLCCICLPSQAQEIITSSGDYGTTVGAKITWTIGEPITETFGTNPILTQGFNQSNLIISKIKNNEPAGLTIKVYPNPADNLVKIIISDSDPENLRYLLMDQGGKILSNDDLTGEGSEISVKGLSPATYFLKILKDNKEIKVFKIVKK